ncbi:hypothetical protein RUM44_001586 [Polyplax serrata]|uniref:Uncharacterized protein n=1 Tax=Polyplax serrata TaxID=468196 RepID=A0ABR1AKG0_POLSC
MAMIRSIPGGLKHRDLPDPSYKGIMQLAILAPHNNLAGSVTAALLPTLCAPKIHQQDNTSLSTVGFRNDGNSRILESESIPILEEIAGSSGDEKNTKLLSRGSSFQNQTRNTQKFNLKPKLSLRSISDEDIRDDEGGQRKNLSPKSPKSVSPKNQSPKHLSHKASEFDFNIKTTNGSMKHTESFVTTKSVQEFKSKIPSRTGFENENFQFGGRKKSKGDTSVPKGTNEINPEIPIPNILISCPKNEEEELTKKINHGKPENQIKSSVSDVVYEITRDLNEMEIVREGKKNEIEEEVEIHMNNMNEIEIMSPENGEKVQRDKGLCGGRRGSQTSEIRRSSCKKGSIGLSQRDSGGSESSALTEITKYGETPSTPPKTKARKKSKSLSWKKKNQDEDEDEEEESATQECLLPQENATDVSLRSVLNHIAYMNRGHQASANAEDDPEKVGKSKIEWVLNITYITAMWGLMLCLSNMGRIYSPFGEMRFDRLETL